MELVLLVAVVVMALNLTGISANMRRLTEHNLRFTAPDDLDRARTALIDLYNFIPRGLCRAEEPDGCPVCVAREVITGESQEARRDALSG